jgi:hypothetical protein
MRRRPEGVILAFERLLPSQSVVVTHSGGTVVARVVRVLCSDLVAAAEVELPSAERKWFRVRSGTGLAP